MTISSKALVAFVRGRVAQKDALLRPILQIVLVVRSEQRKASAAKHLEETVIR